MTDANTTDCQGSFDLEQRWSASDFVNTVQEFLDPVHGFVSYTKVELEVIDHPAFQRLFNICQLGQTYLVYRGATHRRGEHALGTVLVAQRMIDAVNHTASVRHSEALAPRSDDSTLYWAMGESLHPAEVVFIRLAALLHDIGHIVVGHTLEDELGFLPSHDSANRVKRILDYSHWGRPPIVNGNLENTLTPVDTDTLRVTIDEEYKQIADGLRCINPECHPSLDCKDDTYGTVTASEVLLSIITEDPEHDLKLDIQSSMDEFFGSPRAKSSVTELAFRLQVARDIVGNTVCADLIDYLERDSLHLGKSRRFDTRLFQYMSIRTPSDGSPSRLVLELDTKTPGQIRPDVLSGVLELLENRYRLWEIALLHKTKTCASAMLERALVELASHTTLFSSTAASVHDVSRELLSYLLELSDDELYVALARFPWDRFPIASAVDTDKLEEQLRPNGATGPRTAAHKLLSRLRYRQLYKEIDRITDKGDHIGTEQIAKRLTIGGPLGEPVDISTEASLDERDRRVAQAQINTIKAARKRTNALRQLEYDLDLELGSLAMYCSPWGLGSKVAAVQVFHHNQVKTLSDLGPSPQAAGGYLQAQLDRFIQLWRTSLFISPVALKKLEERGLCDILVLAFRIGVARCDIEPLSMETIANMLAGRSGRPSYADPSRVRSRVSWRSHVEEWTPKHAAARGEKIVHSVYEWESPTFPTSGRATLRSWFGSG